MIKTLVNNDVFYLFSYASGIAGANPITGTGPLSIKNSTYWHDFSDKDTNVFQWQTMVEPKLTGMTVLQQITEMSTTLAKQVSTCVKQAKPFCVLGGDHSSAIGTWSGVEDAIHEQGELGLIWIDAHMDSHTPETSPSGNIHGMPLASLLGYGNDNLTNILNARAKLKPQHVCLIGIRSYEPGEQALLERLNVRIYYIDEVLQRGLQQVMQEAIQYVNQGTVAYGVTIDIDSIDPVDAPAVDVPEAGGLRAQDVLNLITQYAQDTRWIGTEIVEFNPSKDQNKITEKLIIELLQRLQKAKS